MYEKLKYRNSLRIDQIFLLLYHIVMLNAPVLSDTAQVTKTFEEVARFEGGGEFHCCTLLANGKVVMVPYNYPATVLFDPVAKTFEEVCNLEGGNKRPAHGTQSARALLFIPRLRSQAFRCQQSACVSCYL